MARARSRRLDQPLERRHHLGYRRRRALAADHRDRSLAHRAGEPRLAAHKNRDQRHAQRSRQMKQAGIDADDEGGPRNQAGHAVERLPFGTRALPSAAAIRTLRTRSVALPQGSTSNLSATRQRLTQRDPRASGHSFSALAVACRRMP